MNRFSSRLSYPLSILALGAVLTLPAVSAMAKPKKIVSNGCTMEQIQSPAAGGCIDKMEDDILNNRPTYHAVYCSSTGRILCCRYDQAGNTVDHSCEIIGNRRPQASVADSPGRFGVAKK
ncbi:hypothetical protein FQ775_21940 [Nitratireductor mangrovi]|uniref:Uncharacterized protein n=1 Tax=Nitratireductor mangrovi TaxID=2599600 RepID=A0A5B8L4E7_9HYPH|nr:hypothetical protein [Nitratireductor mangrovi]QDZ02815.1 hypothetical protein FQ775_21940 [Nitratireductor mangrovi]